MSNNLLPRSHRVLLLAAAATLGLGTTVFAQSTTRARSATARPGSTSRSATASQVGLQGYCPVCIVKMKKWVRGNPSIQATYDGKTYYFPGEEQKRMFMASPDQFVPALGGDCAVCMVDMQHRSPGSIQYAALSGNRLFLFPNEKMKEMFRADPAKYNQADLALGGKCPVCRVEMNKVVAGKPDVALTYGGLRYLFPSDEQRKMFIANPSKYAVNQHPAKGSTTKGSITKGSTTK